MAQGIEKALLFDGFPQQIDGLFGVDKKRSRIILLDKSGVGVGLIVSIIV